MGRPAGSPNKTKLTSAEMAIAVLAKVDQMAIWAKHILSEDARVSIDALKYLNDRAWGKPAQTIQGNADKPLTVTLQWGSKPEWIK